MGSIHPETVEKILGNLLPDYQEYVGIMKSVPDTEVLVPANDQIVAYETAKAEESRSDDVTPEEWAATLEAATTHKTTARQQALLAAKFAGTVTTLFEDIRAPEKRRLSQREHGRLTRLAELHRRLPADRLRGAKILANGDGEGYYWGGFYIPFKEVA